MTEHKNSPTTTRLTAKQTDQLAAADRKDDNTALRLGKLRVLATTASDHADKAAAAYEDNHATSLWHAGQAFLAASEATRLQDAHAADGGERWGQHDAEAEDARSSAHLAAAATEGAWEGDA